MRDDGRHNIGLDLHDIGLALEDGLAGLAKIADAITPLGAAPAPTGDGGQVGSMTEAIMYHADKVSAGLGEVAAALDNLAGALERKS